MEDELIPSYQLREAKEEVEALKKMLEAGGGRQEDLLKYRKLKDAVEYSEWYYEEERKKKIEEPVEEKKEETEEILIEKEKKEEEQKEDIIKLVEEPVLYEQAEEFVPVQEEIKAPDEFVPILDPQEEIKVPDEFLVKDPKDDPIYGLPEDLFDEKKEEKSHSYEEVMAMPQRQLGLFYDMDEEEKHTTAFYGADIDENNMVVVYVMDDGTTHTSVIDFSEKLDDQVDYLLENPEWILGDLKNNMSSMRSFYERLLMSCKVYMQYKEFVRFSTISGDYTEEEIKGFKETLEQLEAVVRKTLTISRDNIAPELWGDSEVYQDGNPYNFYNRNYEYSLDENQDHIKVSRDLILGLSKGITEPNYNDVFNSRYCTASRKEMQAALKEGREIDRSPKEDEEELGIQR